MSLATFPRHAAAVPTPSPPFPGGLQIESNRKTASGSESLLRHGARPRRKRGDFSGRSSSKRRNSISRSRMGTWSTLRPRLVDSCDVASSLQLVTCYALLVVAWGPGWQHTWRLTSAWPLMQVVLVGIGNEGKNQNTIMPSRMHLGKESAKRLKGQHLHQENNVMGKTGMSFALIQKGVRKHNEPS